LTSLVFSVQRAEYCTLGEFNTGGAGWNRTVAIADEFGAIDNASVNSVSGFSAKMTPPIGGFDLSTVRAEPPRFVKRSITLVLAAPEDVPISMYVVHPAVGDEQSGMVVQLVELVALDFSRRAMDGLVALAVKTAKLEPPLVYTIKVLK
jgi:hypothetical protein